MRADLLTTREDLVAFRRTINGIRQQIEYDRDYHSKPELFHALDSYLNDVVEHLDEMDSKLKEHVYAYDVTVTVTRRVYVKASDEGDAEQTAIDYAVEELSAPIDWNEDSVEAFRDEDEETTTVYDVEV
jgi:ribosome-associated translation inhibitor RaiA